MRNWKVEEMKLMEMSKVGLNALAVTTPREEMIAEIDAFSNGLLSYVIDLKAKYDAEKDTVIKRDRYGNVSYSSYLSWLKKNDTKNVIYKDGGWDYIGEIPLSKFGFSNACGCIRLHTFDLDVRYHHGYYSSDKTTLVYMYSCLISTQLSAEKSYFCKHDAYELKKEEFRNTEYVSTVCPYWSCSDGTIGYTDADGNKSHFTIEQMDKAIAKAKELAEIIDKMRAELNF